MPDKTPQVYHRRAIKCNADLMTHVPTMVIITGGVVTLQASTQIGRPKNWVRLDEDSYCRYDTGEVFPMKHGEKRTDHMQSLQRSMRTVRDLINANFSSDIRDSAAWLTLTYRECVRDYKRVGEDWESWMRWYRRQVDAPVEYICVLEPQARGAWHIHALIKRMDGKRLYVPQARMLQQWRMVADRYTPAALLIGEDGEKLSSGGVHVHRLADGGDNLGAYLSAYLTDTDGKKGARLKYYPVGMRFFRASKGISRPGIIECASLAEAQAIARKITGTEIPSYDDAYEVVDSEGNRVQAGRTQQYKQRKK